MEKRGGGTHKAPLFYIKSGTTDPRFKGHEIHTPGGALICIPQTSGVGIPPVARARVACCRACVDDAKRRRDTDSKRAKRARRATSERSERVCAAAANEYERAFARVTNDSHGEREARARSNLDEIDDSSAAVLSIDDTRARHAPAAVDLRSFSTSCLAHFVDVDLEPVNGEAAADRSGGRLIDDGSSSRWCARVSDSSSP